MVFKSVFLWGKWGEKQGFSRNSTIDYQVVKCSIWIYSIIYILLVVVALQQQTDREKEKRVIEGGVSELRSLSQSSLRYATRRLIYSLSGIREG